MYRKNGVAIFIIINRSKWQDLFDSILPYWVLLVYNLVILVPSALVELIFIILDSNSFV